MGRLYVSLTLVIFWLCDWRGHASSSVECELHEHTPLE